MQSCYKITWWTISCFNLVAKLCHWHCLLYLLPHSPNPQHICLQIGISIPACFAKMVFSDTAKNNVSAHLLGRICLQVYLLATPVKAVIVPGRFLIILSRGRVRWGSPMLLTALQLRCLVFTIRQCLVLHISLLTLTLPLLRYWCLLTTRLLLNPVWNNNQIDLNADEQSWYRRK